MAPACVEIGPCRLYLGDNLDVMRALPENSLDAIVTDPPYGLGFMGKLWDHGVPSADVWREHLRILKPGGHLLAFAGTRTQHRMASAIEDAGFEIRDMIAWVYGSGFPKSSNQEGEWEGYGTALKPALEPITLARKPLIGTVPQNLEAHRVGALNINGCRVNGEKGSGNWRGVGGTAGKLYEGGFSKDEPSEASSLGRWPANLVHDGSEEVLAHFPKEAGAAAPVTVRNGDKFRNTFGAFKGDVDEQGSTFRGDSGSAARFFYAAKADRTDRNEGLDCCEIVWIECALWEKGVQKVKLRVDTDQFPPRVTAVSGACNNDASAWNMFLFGSPSTGQFRMASMSTTGTRTNSIIGSKTLSYLASSLTSGCIAGASGAKANGGSPAVSAEQSCPHLDITSELTVSAQGVERAVSPLPLRISASVGVCDHPTVKPTDLMQWLIRLVTPPGGTVADFFMGSGSTGKAAVYEGFNFIGCDMDADYFEIAKARIQWAVTHKPHKQLSLL